MKMVVVVLLVVVLMGGATQLGFCSGLPSALLWSPHYRVESSVKYQTLSPKDVAKSVLSEGGWSNFMCSQHNAKTPLDLAVVFLGRESSDFYADKDLVNLLKVSFARSNFSMAYPYIAATEETLANSLLSGFTEICGTGTGFNNVVFSESCSLTGGNSPEVSNLESLNDYLASRVEKRARGEADVIVFCHEGSNSLDELRQTHSEGETLAKLVNSMDQSRERYAILYVSNSFKPTQYPSYREIERFLAEGTNGTGCGEVCKIKSSLLEGLFVGVVLLIILMSGICCMMGIETPTRFEAPQDS